MTRADVVWIEIKTLDTNNPHCSYSFLNDLRVEFQPTVHDAAMIYSHTQRPHTPPRSHFKILSSLSNRSSLSALIIDIGAGCQNNQICVSTQLKYKLNQNPEMKMFGDWYQLSINRSDLIFYTTVTGRTVKNTPRGSK